ncbi:PREDICTED: F-box [Prunus dulcis]|uniref:PREDICTED: F-box n=1 Tax=Prunus dulcis TaxID=3755 RepID=A0A5E4E669_PRUDU|nr:PREDICTED: F-box [Prunus dulcis]
MASPLPSLPSEIFFDHILTRTSLESLGRCRLVSKDWNHITYDSRFWKSFCKRSDSVSGFLIQSQSQIDGKHIQTFVSVDNKANKNLSHAILDFLPVPVKIEAVSQGLVFCVNQNVSVVRDYYVCKPTTLQWEKLPNPKTRFLTSMSAMAVLSSKPLRYKIIRFSSHKYPFSKFKSRQYYNMTCEVFDSNTWAWKRLKNVSLPYCVLLGIDQPYVTSCGAFYWLVRLARSNQVFAFYYEDDKESWEIFDLPTPMEESDRFDYKKLVEYQGRLALIICEGEVMDLWVMENHEKKLWRKRKTWTLSNKVFKQVEGYIPPLAALYNSDIALTKGRDEKLIFYNFEDSSANVVSLGNQPHQVSKLQSDSERVNLRGRWRWFLNFSGQRVGVISNL